MIPSPKFGVGWMETAFALSSDARKAKIKFDSQFLFQVVYISCDGSFVNEKRLQTDVEGEPRTNRLINVI